MTRGTESFDRYLQSQEQAEERRRNFVRAAMDGVKQMASQYGAKVIGPNERHGFVIVFPNDDRMHFDTMEM